MRTALESLAARIRAFWRSDRLDEDFEDEWSSHLELLADEAIARGMTPAEARRAARIRLGGLESLKEQHRAARGLPGIDGVLQDLRLAVRLLGRNRGASAAALLTLALGIGAITVGFTIVHAVRAAELPVEDAGRLFVLCWQNRLGRRSHVSHAELQEWRDRSRTFEALAAYTDGPVNVSGDRALPERAAGARVTANAFGVLRQAPLLGRDFTTEDEQPGAEPVVLIGHRLWTARYGADPSAIGQSLRLNGRHAIIVGVMPDGLTFPDWTEIWTPVSPTELQRAPTARGLRVFGRLREGVDRREAQAEMNGIGQQLIAASPGLEKEIVGVRVETFAERFVSGGRPMFLRVMGAAVFVLLIACLNTANLRLSRSASRAREITVRFAMGATRGRIVRQLLIESAVLGVAGGSIGLVLAMAGARAFDAAMGATLPDWVDFSIDASVFGFVAATCLLTVLIAGLVPALHVSKRLNGPVLKGAARGQAGTRRERSFSSAIVVAELALTIVLLVGAGLMVRSFMALYFADLGFKPDNLMTVGLQLPGSTYPTAQSRQAFYERLQARAGVIPGVEHVAVTNGVPPLDGGERLLEVEGQAAGVTPVHVGTVTITRPFFDVLGVRVVRGRAFSDRDGAPGSEAVVINQRLADRFFPGEDPIGRRLRFTQPAPGRPPEAWRTVVGISGRIEHGSNIDSYLNSVVYIPFRQESPAAASLLVRSALPPHAVADAIRREVQGLDADQPLLTAETVAQVWARDRWWYRTWGATYGILAAIAVLLSSVGLYAVMAHAVTRRTQEIGLRIAVGAQRWQVSWLILRRGLGQVAIGLALGLGGAVALGRVLRFGLAAISPTDPLTLAAVTAFLTIVSVAACLLPAWRAMRVDPVVALRAE